nr:MAG TPA: Rubredoxin loop, ELECTRON TRANSPORT [Caudoviricetes sp.]
MGDLISRSALLEALANRNLSDEFYDHGLDWENASRETQRAVEVQGAAIKRIINLAPAYNNGRHGKWVWDGELTHGLYTVCDDFGWRCNVCNVLLDAYIDRCARGGVYELVDPDVPPILNYCPNCGAKMMEDDE